MRFGARIAAVSCAVVLSACAARTVSRDHAPAPATDALARLWDAEHVSDSHSPLVDHAAVERRLNALPGDLFTVREAGRSVEGRAIYHVKAGTGPMPVL